MVKMNHHTLDGFFFFDFKIARKIILLKMVFDLLDQAREGISLFLNQRKVNIFREAVKIVDDSETCPSHKSDMVKLMRVIENFQKQNLQKFTNAMDIILSRQAVR